MCRVHGHPARAPRRVTRASPADGAVRSSPTFASRSGEWVMGAAWTRLRFRSKSFTVRCIGYPSRIHERAHHTSTVHDCSSTKSKSSTEGEVKRSSRRALVRAVQAFCSRRPRRRCTVQLRRNPSTPREMKAKTQRGRTPKGSAKHPSCRLPDLCFCVCFRLNLRLN